MNNNKVLLISLLPGLLALVFAVYVTLPSVGSLKHSFEKLNNEKKSMEETQNNLSKLKRNDKLLNELYNMRNDLYDFDIKVPPTDDLAILLVDLDKFAQSRGLKVTSFKTKSKKAVDLENSTGKKKKKKKKSKTGTQALNLVSIPIETVVVGYYPEILKFIKDVEHYQRKVVIKDVAIKNYKNDKNSAKPKVEVTVSYTVYKTETPQAVAEVK